MNRNVLASLALAVGLFACADDVTLIPRVAGLGVPITDAPSMAARYQKFDQYGQHIHTDPDQRKEDIIACGVPREWYNDSLSNMGGSNKETFKQSMARTNRFWQCMEDKGYVQFDLEECGPVKENRGICR